jgi:nucleotidyltransferase substrate binding protein (TIGR01987 family)
MDKQRFIERQNEFAKAVQRLRDAVGQQENEFIRDAVIQRFEFTYELAWKAIKLYLESKDIDVRNPKDTLREALVQGLIENGDLWSELHRMRNLTSHTYDEKLAVEVYQFVKTYALDLFNRLAKKLEAAGHSL